MITQFHEQSILTSPTTSKTLQFTADNILISGSGNRLLEYNLYNNSVKPILNTRFNVKHFSVHNQQLYATVDDQHNLLCNNKHIKSKNKQIKQIQYSPDGKMLAIAYQHKLIIYNLQMEKIKVHSNKHKISGMAWSPDCRFILTWGDDNSVIINSVFSLRLYQDVMLQAHKFKIASAFFLTMEYIITADVLGKVCLWKFVNDYVTEQFQKRQKHQKSKSQHHLGIENDQSEYTTEELEYMSEFEKQVHIGRFILEKKINIKEKLIKHFAAIKSIVFHQLNNLMIIGMKNGVLTLFKVDVKEEPFLTQLQSFQITTTQIDSLAINKNGNWIALGMRNTGQLIIWEWRSQSYILNQQSLSYETTCCTINQDTIAIGTLGGVIRLFDQNSHFCIAKFDDQHNSKVTGIKYCPQKQGVLVSCSLDGTVRAYDTIRLKCFRVFQPEIPNQLQCLDIEPSGELICAGGFDPYEIYVFSLQTGQLVEVISGHQAPVMSLKFIQTDEKVLLISGSWDKTIRIHDLYARGMKEGSGGDQMLHNSEVTALAAKDNQVAVATMGGELIVWDIKDTLILFSFDVHRDVQGGRISKETLAAQKNQNLKYFVSIEYSKDGQYLLGGGNSKFVCLYDMKYRILIRRFVISNNLSLDGMKLKVNFSTIDQENKNIEDSDEENQQGNLPGAKNYDVSKRNSKRVPIQIFNIEFTESNREFVVSNCEGVSIFGSQKQREYFDPIDIDETVSIEEIQKKINELNYVQALQLSLKLNQQQILLDVFQSIPVDQIITVVPAIPESLIVRLLETTIDSMQTSRNVEIDLIWIKQILIDFAHLIKGPSANRKVQNTLQEVLKQVRLDFNRIKDPIRKCINVLDYISN